MQKAVLISISPKWCDLIKSGEKTLAVRKKRPSQEPPFLCYIYETFAGNGLGKVIGEFICDFNAEMFIECSNPDNLSEHEYRDPCFAMTVKEMIDYLGNGKRGYAWHISELVIYDEPIDVYAFYSATTGKQLTRPPQSWCYVKELED